MSNSSSARLGSFSQAATESVKVLPATVSMQMITEFNKVLHVGYIAVICHIFFMHVRLNGNWHVSPEVQMN